MSLKRIFEGMIKNVPPIRCFRALRAPRRSAGARRIHRPHSERRTRQTHWIYHYPHKQSSSSAPFSLAFRVWSKGIGTYPFARAFRSPCRNPGYMCTYWMPLCMFIERMPSATRGDIRRSKLTRREGKVRAEDVKISGGEACEGGRELRKGEGTYSACEACVCSLISALISFARKFVADQMSAMTSCLGIGGRRLPSTNQPSLPTRPHRRDSPKHPQTNGFAGVPRPEETRVPAIQEEPHERRCGLAHPAQCIVACCALCIGRGGGGD